MKRLFHFVATALMAGASLPLARATNSDPSNVASTRPNEDEDQDGLTNQEEAEMGTFPYNAYSDADSVKDGEDGWPLVTEFTFPRRPAFRYAVIPLGSVECVDINNLGVVLRKDGAKFENGVWGSPITWTPAAAYYAANRINDTGNIVGTVFTQLDLPEYDDEDVVQMKNYLCVVAT